jgi:hypothetical protein
MEKMLWAKHKTSLQMPQDTTFVWVIITTMHKDKIVLLEWKMCMFKDIIHNFGPPLCNWKKNWKYISHLNDKFKLRLLNITIRIKDC